MSIREEKSEISVKVSKKIELHDDTVCCCIHSNGQFNECNKVVRF